MHYEPIHFLRLHCTYIILDLLQHLPPQDFKSPDKKTPIPIGLKKKRNLRILMLSLGMYPLCTQNT